MNTQTAQHTPTPWKVWPEHTTGITTHRTDAKTCCVARALECKDAAFIVRAVNAYQPLLDALKFVADKINDPALVLVIVEAIAEAEGR